MSIVQKKSVYGFQITISSVYFQVDGKYRLATGKFKIFIKKSIAICKNICYFREPFY